MARIKLTKAVVAGLPTPNKGQAFTWDSIVKGFGVRVTHTGAKSYIAQFKVRGGKERRMVVGRCDRVPLDKARTEANRLISSADLGHDPAIERREAKNAKKAKTKLHTRDVGPGALSGVRVLDLTRILAGPFCTQMLGDLGADVIKVERPGAGDDTRHWGPNYIPDGDGNPSGESAYFVSANRNKRSVTIDIGQTEGAALVRELAQHADILVENYKVGGLQKYGLSYADLKADNPGLIYCSITGFGQDGPYADRAGYDFMIQGMGGIMSLTGEPDGQPMKTGVAIADVMCGMYAATAILAALRHRDQTGQGQYIDMALLDTQAAWLINQGLDYLTTGEAPTRHGNAHPNIVPYEAFAAADGYIILAVGNDRQFQRFCAFAGLDGLAVDDRFATNNARVKHRDVLIPEIARTVATQPVCHWLDGLAEIGVPCGPVNDLAQVFDDPQLRHRNMVVELPHESDPRAIARQIGSPMKLSQTPVSYRRSAPGLGQHSDDVLGEVLGLSDKDLQALRTKGVI